MQDNPFPQTPTPQAPITPPAPQPVPEPVPAPTPMPEQPTPEPAPEQKPELAPNPNLNPNSTIGDIANNITPKPEEQSKPDQKQPAPRTAKKFPFNLTTKLKPQALIGIIAGGAAVLIGIIVLLIVILNQNPLIGKWTISKYYEGDEDRTETYTSANEGFSIEITDDHTGTIKNHDSNLKVLYDKEHIVSYDTESGIGYAYKYEYKDNQLTFYINSYSDVAYKLVLQKQN